MVSLELLSITLEEIPWVNLNGESVSFIRLRLLSTFISTYLPTVADRVREKRLTSNIKSLNLREKGFSWLNQRLLLLYSLIHQFTVFRWTEYCVPGVSLQLAKNHGNISNVKQ